MGYIRVSTMAQVDQGQSLAEQERALQINANQRNLGLIEIFSDEGVSGYDLQRPRLNALRERIRSGELDVLLVRNIDRLTRSGLDLKALLEEPDQHTVRLVTIDDWFGGRRGLDSRKDRGTLEGIITFAEWERDGIGHATRTAHENLRQQGRAFNRDLYGFDKTDGGRLEPNQQELQTLTLIRELQTAGKSASQIAGQLNSEGRLGKRGGQWQAKTVPTKLKHLTDYAVLYAPVLPQATHADSLY